MTNITDLHIHTFWTELEDEEIMKRIPVSVFVGLLAIVGIVGNLHILIVVSRNIHHHSTYHVLISALAVSDLFVCVTYLPVEIAMVMKPFSFDYDVTCRLAMLNSYLWGIWTVFLILLIAVERYRRICHPVSGQISCSTARKLCAVLFIIAMFNAVPMSYISGTHTFALSNTTKGYECFISDTLGESYLPLSYFIFLLVEVLVIGFGIAILYFHIHRAITSSIKRRKQLTKARDIADREQPERQSNWSREPNFNGISVVDSEERYSQFTEYVNNQQTTSEQQNTHSSSRHLYELRPNTSSFRLSVTSLNSLGCHKLQTKRTSSSSPLCTIKRETITNNATRVTVGLFLITIIFFVTLITFMVLTLLRILAKETLNNMSATEAYIFLFGFELGYLNHVVNSFIYFYNDRRFRKELKAIYSCQK
jgi:hypothetical protein